MSTKLQVINETSSLSLAPNETTIKIVHEGIQGAPGVGANHRSGICGGLVNGSNTIFSIPTAPTAQSLLIFRNGVRQLLTDDYTVIGLLITFAVAPRTGDSITYSYNEA